MLLLILFWVNLLRKKNRPQITKDRNEGNRRKHNIGTSPRGYKKTKIDPIQMTYL